ncbi:hypothetical protein FOCC_FOCC000808 [Frankliniella occidentalis]|nr:hypothetical protein FOCC_FOCC000808 [Frankliniella occidentalis]
MEGELNPDDCDEPMGESDDSDGGLEDVPPRFHVLHNHIDERHHAADFVGNCRVKCNATRAGVRAAIEGCETLLEARFRNLKASVQQYIEEQELHALPASVRLLEKFDVKTQFSGLKSNEGQINAIKSYNDYIQPMSCFLGVRMQQINIGEFQYRQRPVRETYQYVSIQDILKMVARKQSVMEYIYNQHPSDDGMLRSFTDGYAYANHPFFQTYPNAFQLGLFYDDIETTSPIGSKKGIHNMAFFAVKVLNVPQYIKSVLGGYHVVALAHKTDIDKNGFRPSLQNLIDDDCRELESEQGVVTYIGDQRVVQRACLCAVFGDTKAVHEILGFLSPSARHFCRLCMNSRPQLHAGVGLSAPRTIDLHNQHLRQNVNNPDNSTNNGAKENSCLHQLTYFHSSNNYCLDSMHDIAEGCGAWEIKLILRHFDGVRGVFMPFDLNRRINGYNYGFADRLNPPSGFFNIEGLRTAFTNHNLIGTSAQTFCLLRVLPLLLDRLGDMPDNDDHLRLLLLLQTIVQIVRAPVLPRTMMPYLQDLIADHRRLFSELFPGLDPIKKHHLEHYVQCMLKMGLLEQYNCMRGEASMRPMKRHIVAAGSYRDVCKTGVEYAQISQAMMWSTDNPTVVAKFKLESAKTAVQVHECHTAALLNDPGGFRDDDIVHKRTENPNDLEAFGKIVGIVVANNDEDVWFEIEECETVYLHPRFNAKVIRMPRHPIIHLYDPLDLPQHPPLSALHDFSTGNDYLVLRHVIV